MKYKIDDIDGKTYIKFIGNPNEFDKLYKEINERVIDSQQVIEKLRRLTVEYLHMYSPYDKEELENLPFITLIGLRDRYSKEYLDEPNLDVPTINP